MVIIGIKDKELGKFVSVQFSDSVIEFRRAFESSVEKMRKEATFDCFLECYYLGDFDPYDDENPIMVSPISKIDEFEIKKVVKEEDSKC